MYLEGQDGQRGYAMAALLVAIGVMAVLMTAAMPVWRHEAQREKEIETIFRGEQIARAIAMFREKNAGNFPTSLDLLVQQRYLRKKYKDPFAEDGEWVPIGGLANQPQQGGRGGAPQTGQPGPSLGSQVAGIMGVTLKDKGASIVEYHQATHHNEWQFLFTGARSRAGASQGARGGGPGGNAGQPGRGRPGGPGGPGGIGGRGPGGGRGQGGRGTGPGRGGGPGRGFGPGAGTGRSGGPGD